MANPSKILSPLARLVFGSKKAPGSRIKSDNVPGITQKQEAMFDELLHRSGDIKNTAKALGLSRNSVARYVANTPARAKLDLFINNSNMAQYPPDALTRITRNVPTDAEIIKALEKHGGNRRRAAKEFPSYAPGYVRNRIGGIPEVVRNTWKRPLTPEERLTTYQRYDELQDYKALAKELGITESATLDRLGSKSHGKWLEDNPRALVNQTPYSTGEYQLQNPLKERVLRHERNSGPLTELTLDELRKKR